MDVLLPHGRSPNILAEYSHACVRSSYQHPRSRRNIQHPRSRYRRHHLNRQKIQRETSITS